MQPMPFVVFVCEHGAAKSILAAAYFNVLAARMGLNITAVARGTNPDPELSEQVITGLSRDGLESSEATPRKLSSADVHAAQQIVSFCKLPDEFHDHATVEQWDGIPAVSEDYEKARDVIVERLYQLLNSMRSSL